MSFGFSLGDFIATFQLISKATSLVQNAPGDYQDLVSQMQTLQFALNKVREIGWLEDEECETSTIQDSVQKCNASLQVFRNRVKDYDASLGKWSTAGRLKQLRKKLIWGATGQAEAAQKLQHELAGYVGCLNMALQVYSIKKTEQQHVEVRAVIEETCREVYLLQLNSNNERKSSSSSSFIQDIEAVGSLPARLLTVIRKEDETRRAPQAASGPLYGEITFQDPVVLHDAMGRRIPIPSEYSLGLIQVVLCYYFQSGPGRDCVESRYYDLFYSDDKSRKLNAGDSTPLVPGSSIIMAIWVSQRMSGCCPKSSCPGGRIAAGAARGYTCETCGIWFDAFDSTSEKGVQGIENTSGRSQQRLIRRGSRHSDPFKFIKLTAPDDFLDNSQITCG
ncbi:MAG: hypothetical protein MMC33_010026 [Icmadophila ericetorum]|nr:hypothetical protein [Icmadophila ericetorum]